MTTGFVRVCFEASTIGMCERHVEIFFLQQNTIKEMNAMGAHKRGCETLLRI